MPRRSLVAVLVVGLLLAAAGRADAVTVRDVIELSKAGLSDSVLLALIDVDRSVFSIDAATLKQLKSSGVSDAVIVAMIRSGREPRVEDTTPPVVPQEPAPMPEPEQPVQPDAAIAPSPYPVAIPVPVYVAVPIVAVPMAQGAGRRGAMRHDEPPAIVQPATGQPIVAPNCQSARVPEWGFGGTIRRLPPACR